MPDSTSGTPLRRLHRALVQALRERDPAGLGRPFTVAEIYQDLVPYRTHRDVLAVDMNGDYEHLVLRLLAGEEGLVALESEHARKQLADELSRSNPNTGLYREYAAVDVHLVAEHIPPEGEDGAGEAVDTAVILPAEAPASEAPDEDGDDVTASVDDFAPADADGDDPDDQADELEAAGVAEAAGDGGVRRGDDGVCHWCRGTLPQRENLNFCPFCGTDIGVVPCPSCGEAVEPGWRFCIQCGATTDDG